MLNNKFQLSVCKIYSFTVKYEVKNIFIYILNLTLIFIYDLKGAGECGKKTWSSTSDLPAHQPDVRGSGGDTIWTSVRTKGHREAPQIVRFHIGVFVFIGFHRHTVTSGSSTEYKDGRHESTSKVVFDLMMKTDKKHKKKTSRCFKLI